MRSRIERNSANREAAVGSSAGQTSLNHPQAGGKFLYVKRLGHVVIGAAIQSAHFILGTVARGQQQHWQAAIGFAQRTQYLQAVHVGEAEIEHYHVGRLGTDCSQGVGSASDMIYGKTFTA
tara:strand:- start:2846 stop:3208 length:363 start_codon:yes stop_codon:yes gene_type:complete